MKLYHGANLAGPIIETQSWRVQFSRGRGYMGDRVIWWPRFGQIGVRIGAWWYSINWWRILG